MHLIDLLFGEIVQDYVQTRVALKKGLAVYFGVTAPFHEAVVIGCATTGLGFMACMSSVGLILEIPDLIAIGSLTIGYLQIRNQCFDRYGCKEK